MAARVHSGAAIACYQFLEKGDAVTKQVIKYTERIIDVSKRVPNMAQFKGAFELALTKIKKPDRLERTDMIQGEIPLCLQPVFEEIKVKNEELSEKELWNTESIAFTYYNILQQYKTQKQVSVCPPFPLL